MQRARPWLADAQHVVIVRDASDDPVLAEDPVLRELSELDWRAALVGLPPHDVVDWVRDPAACAEAITRACAACAAVAPMDPLPSPSPPPLELPLGGWSACTTDGAVAWRRLEVLAAQLAVRDGRAWLHADAAGTMIDLAAPPAALVLAAAGDAARPPGTRYPAGTPADERRLRPGYLALGFDPHHPIGWRGARMRFDYVYVGRDEIGYLSASDHDFPCGPAKKLYGYADNEPVQIQLTPTADACAARFEHDVLVTSAIPIPWTCAGDVDVAVFATDPRRAVFFAQEAEPRTDDLLDDDARDLAPALVLGPDDAARYALDLGLRVYRITRPPGAPDRPDGEAVHVGGPHDGYAVFDADHRLVRRGTGRLLGGWYRHATIEDAGAYWREDLATGVRTRLAPVDFTLCDDPEHEAIALDAVREGRHDEAAQIRARHPSHRVDGDGGEPEVIAIPGTTSILLVTARHVRVV
ncbi:MAG: hypothetical protein NT062_27215 [Proteobacteria bacterium]|nr:hypothetical protein [Pseudomonadota bacterium]